MQGNMDQKKLFLDTFHAVLVVIIIKSVIVSYLVNQRRRGIVHSTKETCHFPEDLMTKEKIVVMKDFMLNNVSERRLSNQKLV